MKKFLLSTFALLGMSAVVSAQDNLIVNDVYAMPGQTVVATLNFSSPENVYKGMHIFPVQYFCPRQTTGEYLLTADTYCDHHFMGSWSGGGGKRKSSLAKLISQKNMTRLIKLKRKILG